MRALTTASGWPGFSRKRRQLNASLEKLTEDLCRALGSTGVVVDPGRNQIPRYSLFHAAGSICSQKVRVVLAQHRIAYRSHLLNIFSGETYLPNHVRLRLIGCERSGLPLVNAHTGSTSMSAGGCDPAVVPTLVDWQTYEVIVDSKQICLYLDATMPDAERLRPGALREAIDTELTVVDNLPNYQMLAGRPVGEDSRPQTLRDNNGVDFALGKVARCDQYLSEYTADALLGKAYQAKRSKELNAAEHLFSEEAMRVAYAKAQAACAELDAKLAAHGDSWLLANNPTMADLFWAVELLRMKNLGAAHIWKNNKLPAVERFVVAVERLESVRAAVITWPGALY